MAGYAIDRGSLAGFEARLAVTNLFDEAPPLFQTLSPIIPPYDPTNYSSVGRVINLTLTKRF